MSDSALMREDVYRQPVDAAQFGVVAKPLSTWERVYNVTIVRKLVILVVLAAAWELYARWLNNPLLFPTFGFRCLSLLGSPRSHPASTARTPQAKSPGPGTV